MKMCCKSYFVSVQDERNRSTKISAEERANIISRKARKSLAYRKIDTETALFNSIPIRKLRKLQGKGKPHFLTAAE